jgi:hypothetical protein
VTAQASRDLRRAVRRCVPNRLGAFEEGQHRPGQVAPATRIEVEDHPSDVRAGSVEAAALTGGCSVPEDLTEELRSHPATGWGGEQLRVA